MGDPRSGGVSDRGGHPPAGSLGDPDTTGGAALGRGDRAVDVASGARGRAVLELVGLWLVTLLLIRAAVFAREGLGAPDFVLAAVPLLFIYMPVLLCRWRGVDSWGYRLSIPAFGDLGAWRLALRRTAIGCLVLLVPFVGLYHLYQGVLFDRGPGAGLPDSLLILVAHQIFFVALPEEFFYRGYFQTRLNEVFPRKWLIFGVPMGWGAIIATLLFAFGHSLVVLQWWHFATFFPGLVFAWYRERTGGVVTGAFFHAACNILVAVLDHAYGVI